MRTTTDPLEVLDILGGALTGNYKEDVLRSEKLCQITFSLQTYT